MDDDDDAYLYGDPAPAPTAPETIQPTAPKPVNLQGEFSPNGVVARLEAEAEAENEVDTPMPMPMDMGDVQDSEQEGTPQEDEEGDEGEESEDDIEFIMEAPTRSMDFRGRTSQTRSTAVPSAPRGPAAPAAPPPSLTTEYIPHQRGVPTGATQQAAVQALSSTPLPRQQQQQQAPLPPLASQHQPDRTSSTPATTTTITATGTPSGDTSSLPPVTAAPSHPQIDPAAIGTLDDGRSILEYDLNALSEKPWRRPGSDISDWFNYGFDELSWEAYCFRRREVGEMGGVLKASVVNFSGMPEDQLTALPMEVRQMVMTGANAMMNNMGGVPVVNPGPNPGMMGMMGDMGVGVGHGHHMADMGMGMGMHPDVVVGAGQDSGHGQMMPGDAFGPGMMMPGGEFGLQETPMNPQMFQQHPMDVVNVTPNPQQQQAVLAQQQQAQIQQQIQQIQQQQQQQAQTQPPGMQPQQPMGMRGGAYRGRGMGMAGIRGRGGVGGVGGVSGVGGGGGYGAGRGRVPIPVRPASPLPPGVPTGPRNQNKYKDRDNNAQAVDGLDYGGGAGGGGRESSVGSGTAQGDDERARKRRGSSGAGDERGGKRR